jgi:DNA-binding transcriptional ArsR family regulator
MKHAEEIADPRVIKALSHPLRVQILSLLDGNVRSPKELAGELGEPLGNVSYHVRTLADLDLIELLKKVPRRGAIEHYYRAPSRLNIRRAVVRVDEAGRRKLVGEMARFIERASAIGKQSKGGDGDEMDVMVMLSELPGAEAA